MKKINKILVATLLLTFSMCMTAFAGTWQQDASGWRWQNDDGSYPKATWQWIDGDGDGIAESYYFDANGYLLTNTTAPGGYTVDANGAWIENGVVQQKAVGAAVAGNAGSTTGNAGDAAARQLYLDASTKTGALTSMAANAKIDMTMSMEGESIPVTMTMDMKFKDLGTASMKYLVDVNMNMMGLQIPATMFYTDGYYYMNIMDEKTKMPMDLTSMMEEVESNVGSAGMSSSIDYLENFQMSDAGDGNTFISFTSDANIMGDYLDSIYAQMGIDAGTVNVKGLSCSVLVNSEGYCVAENITMDVDMTASGQTVSVNMVMQLNYVNVGQPVDFTLPSTDGYTLAQQ